MNLGIGSEIGLYKQSKESKTHYDAVDFLTSMQISTYKYSKGNVSDTYFNWNPIDDKQWWITAFDWRHPKPKKKELVTIVKIDFVEVKDMSFDVFYVLKNVKKKKNKVNDALLDAKNNIIWVEWR